MIKSINNFFINKLMLVVILVSVRLMFPRFRDKSNIIKFDINFNIIIKNWLKMFFRNKLLNLKKYIYIR